MPTFGQHETAQRLHQTGVGAIHTLKSDEKRVLKVLQPPEGIWTDQQLREEVDAFLLRLKTQRDVAKTAKTWAPVHEVKALGLGAKTFSRSGNTVGPVPRSISPSGAYAVLDRYERSVQSLINGRVRVTNNDLRNVLGTVIRGLIDIKKHVNRPHGNVKPSNILLANSTDLATAIVHLSDPAADGSLTKNSDKKDLADLAKILFELVNLRPYAGGTISPSKEWNALGPNGEDWRKLCNALLDPGAPADERDLEKISPQIDTWLKQPKKSKAPMLAVAAIVIVIVGIASVYIFTRPPKIDFDQPRWEKLCLSYHAWFGDFLDNMTDDEKKKLSAAPYPAQIVKLLNDARRDLPKYEPKAIAKQGQTPKFLAANPTDAARTGYGPYYTKQGAELIDRIRDVITPAQWPLLGTLDTTASAWEKRRWMKPAVGIRGVIAAARPPAVPTVPVDVAERAKSIMTVDVLAEIQRTINISTTINDIERRWTNIESQIQRLPQTHVPILDAFPKFAEEFPRSGEAPPAASQPDNPPVEGTLKDVESLATAFTTIEKVVTQLASDLNRKDQEIVYVEFAKDPAAQLPADGKITIDMYTHVPEIAQGYVKLPTDPRAAVPWNATLDQVQNGMIKVITTANPQDKNLPVLIQHRDALQQELAVLNPISPIQKNRAQLETLVAKAKTDLTQLTGEGNEWVSPYIVHPAEFIAQQRARLTTSPLLQATAVVRDEWVKADTAFLNKVAAESAGLQTYPYDKYQNYVRKFKLLETIYTDFDAKIPAPPNVEGLSTIQGNDWRHTIAAKVATTYRDAALTDLMTNPALKWSDDLPQVDNPAYQSFSRERVSSYDRTRLDAVALINDYSTIESRLNQLDLQKDEPAAGAVSWRILSDKWKTNPSPLLADAEIVGALRPLTTRVGDLLAIDALADYPSLVQRTTAPAPEVVLTSWRKLAVAPVNETLPVLTDEDAAETHLVSLLTTSTKAGTLDNARAAAINNELKTQRPQRWHHWADTLVSAVPIQTALDRRASFNVTLNPQTDARMVFNDAFYNLRKQSDANLKEPALKLIAQSFINAVNAMPAPVTRDQNIQAILARIAKPLQQTNEESSSAGAGPKLAGWEQDPSPDASVRRFYLPSKASPQHTLEFDRLQVGQKTIYLCTTEMSFGLFADTVNTPAHFSALDNTGKSTDKQHWFKTSASESWLGPRVWNASDGKFVPNVAVDDRVTKVPVLQWLFKDPLLPDSTSYYPNKTTPAPPGPDMPMQQISPWSAIYVSRLLGCRLPTSEEWKAAYAKFETTAQTKDAWNLRGAAWQAQQNYSKQMANNGMAYPDAGMFNTPDLMFAGITADAALPWKNSDLSKLAPNRISPGATIYNGSTIWFRRVGTQPGLPPPTSGAGAMHDLVGNVAEYTFDAPTANAVIKDAKPTIDGVDTFLPVLSKDLGVIGGSSLSPPQIPFNEKQTLDPDVAQTSTGFSDVGFRLAYTAPIDSINDVLAAIFKDPKYLSAK